MYGCCVRESTVTMQSCHGVWDLSNCGFYTGLRFLGAGVSGHCGFGLGAWEPGG